ncbi:MAG: hypothetical protein K2X35_07955 [Bryobacteraceae bacterium]|nr:hypothetical protein [Bryobacteraceae bacterium]
MTLGAEPKKVVILVALLVVAAAAYWWSSREDTPAGAAQAPAGSPGAAAAPAAQPAGRAPAPAKPKPRQSSNMRTLAEFKPTLKVPEGLDLTTVEPTLKLQALAKVREASVIGGSRSLFDFSAVAPAKPANIPPVKPIKPAPLEYGPRKPEPEPARVEPPKPPPPPITLKFYGFQTPRPGVKKAFFLDGDEILMGSEGDVLKKRYKIVRIGVNSVVVEDTEHQNQQTLRLEQESTSG